MNQSELILSTYRAITSHLGKPYYIMEGIPANDGSNQILFSSPNIKEIVGLTQFDLSHDSSQFYDSIHPDFIGAYFESNRRLLKTSESEKRIYLIKNKETGQFVPVEELASTRLNLEKNRYEIYCSLRSVTGSFEAEDETDIEMISKAFIKINHLDPESKAKIFEPTQEFIDSMSKHFKMNACRFYGFNESKKELFILADSQTKRYKQLIESSTRLKTRSIVPNYSKDNYLYELFFQRKNIVLTEKDDIINVLKSHTDNSLIKCVAFAAVRIYRLKSFGILPIICADNKLVGLVTFGSSQLYNQAELKEIYDFTTTNTFVFTCLLENYCAEL